MNYESDRTLGEYLLLHYGSAEDILGNLPGPKEAVLFPTRIVRELLDITHLPASPRALDLGCAVGGSSFELTRHCKEVYGVDSSQKFISAAQHLAKHGRIDTVVAVEGEMTQPFEALVPGDLPRERALFEVANALELPPNLGQFDVVLAANLLCRLPTPRLFLESLPSLVRGQLLLVTPFSWLEEFTPKNAWLGGGTTAHPSWEVLKEILSPHFQLEEEKNLPFLIREHARKFQYGVSLGSRWTRRVSANAMDWNARYEIGDTPWDYGEAHPELVHWLAHHRLPSEVLVLGCGKGYDVNAIAKTDTSALGIDISTEAIRWAKQNKTSHSKAQFQVADLFALPKEWRGRFKSAFEHTCYCAIEPSRRRDYVASLAEVLQPGADLLACFYLHPESESGPPFPTSYDELDQLFEPYFLLKQEWVPSHTYTHRKGRELFRSYIKRHI